MQLARAGLLVLVVAGCGRIGFDPDGASTCGSETATPIELGASIESVLCAGDTDVFAVALLAGEELEATLVTHGVGWPALELVDDNATTRAVRTFGRAISGFADHDGIVYVRITGVAAAAGTPYRLDVGKRAGRHVFVAPIGNDAASGSFAEPWQHLDVAIDRLIPGDVLVLKDGGYTVAANKTLLADCSLTSRSGTATAPIRVTALTERGAGVRADGVGPAMRIAGGCSYWSIEGLNLANQDNPGAFDSNDGPALAIKSSSNITIRRLLLSRNNRYVNSHLLQITSSSNILVEDTEVYDFHRAGVLVFGSRDSVVRRTFSASRGNADIPGGFVSDSPDRGDAGIDVSHSQNVVVENFIDEANGALEVFASFDADSIDARVLGSISLHSEYGLLSSVGSGGAQNNVRTVVENMVAIESKYFGFYARSNMGFACRGCTSIRSENSGWAVDQLSVQPRASSASCTSCLMVDNGNYGFRVVAQDAGWQIASSNSFGNGTAFNPSSGPELVAPVQVDPELGGCLVYLPSGSPMVTAGPGGTPIGAQIIYRYQDGVLTDIPLWSPETGEFPCGAVVVGINDDPATSCIGVHKRLHVGIADCALPYPDL